jgi:hypothetical protein
VTVTGNPAAALRPRSGPEIIDAVVPLLRRAYWPCVAVWLSYVIVYRIAYGALGMAQRPIWVRFVLDLFLSAVPIAVMQRLLSDAYLGVAIDLPRVVVSVCRRAPDILGVLVARSVLAGLALVAIVVPGIVCWARTFAALLAVVVEGNAPMEAIDRSWRLTRGHVWRIILVVGITYTIYLCLWAAIARVHTAAVTHHILTGPIRTAIAGCLGALLAPFVPAVVVVLYYDLRIRNEAFDLELQLQMIGSRPA